jgi:hypothetical protein
MKTAELAKVVAKESAFMQNLARKIESPTK